MTGGWEFPDVWYGGMGWWGQHEPLSMVTLIQNGTLDAHTAALCWLLIENRVSYFVCAGPQRAGKTTTATALLAFLPPDTTLEFTTGPRETFPFTDTADPSRTWILVNELSNHTPAYLWGPPAARVFDLVEQGYALAATVHADHAEEVMAYLQMPPVRLSPKRLAKTVPLLIFLRAFIDNRSGRRQIERRVAGVQLLEPSPQGVLVHTLAAWDPRTDTFAITAELAAWEAMAQHTGLIAHQQHEEIEERAAFLSGLVQEGMTDFNDVRTAVLRWGARG